MGSHIDLTTNLTLERNKIKMHYRADKVWQHWPFHSHKGYEIYYFQEGVANYLIRDMIYQIEPGDMLVFNGEVLHRVNPEKGCYVRSFINFLPDFIKDNLEETFREKLKVLFESENGTLIRWVLAEREKVDEIIAKIHKENTKELVGSESMMKAYLSQLLIEIYRKSREIDLNFTGANWTQKDNHVQRILKFINQNYMHQLTLDKVADYLHLNKYYMCHCFKEVTGFTINKYIANQRVEEGKKLLLSTEQSVGSISEQLGINNAVQFSRLFKQYVGISPQTYRKEYMKLQSRN